MSVSRFGHFTLFVAVMALLPGMKVNDTSPLVTWQNGQGRIAEVKFSCLMLITMTYKAL